MVNETISAICTPPGDGGIAVIRISGDDSIKIGNRIFSGDVSSYASHTAHFGQIISSNGELIDEVVLLVMHKGRSYTGEETIEIMCHGGRMITQKIFARTLEEGAKTAGPGEFTQRAFLNGKLDLTQAEAICQLISAKNERALQEATKQLKGELSIYIKDFQQQLTDIAAIIEAQLDYPEEGLEFTSTEEVVEMLETTRNKMQKLANTFRDGKIISNNISLCLIGAPNVGKSSVMNALLGKERSIVTNIAGTTRDVVSEDLQIGEFSFSIFDTAGIRETNELIEKEGVKRSRETANEANLILIILDITRPITNDEKILIKEYPSAIIVFNKSDLTKIEHEIDGIKISTKNRDGIEELKKSILDKIYFNHSPNDSILITKERHFSALKNAIHYVNTAITAFEKKEFPELIVIEIKESLKELSQIIGTDITEDILGAIFSKFCVGK